MSDKQRQIIEDFNDRRIFDRAIDMLNEMHKRIGFSDVYRMNMDSRLADRVAQEHMQRLRDDLLAAVSEPDKPSTLNAGQPKPPR